MHLFFEFPDEALVQKTSLKFLFIFLYFSSYEFDITFYYYFVTVFNIVL